MKVDLSNLPPICQLIFCLNDIHAVPMCFDSDLWGEVLYPVASYVNLEGRGLGCVMEVVSRMLMSEVVLSCHKVLYLCDSYRHHPLSITSCLRCSP